MSNERKGVNLRAPHEASEIIGYAYRLYVRHFRVMFLLGLTTVPLQILTAVVRERIGGEAGQEAATPIFLASVAVILVAVCALLHAVNDVATGNQAGFNRSLDAAFPRFFALLTTNALTATLTLLSILAVPYFLARRRYDAACSVPYFAVRWSLAPPAVVIEGKRNWAALDVSATIVRGQWWRTLGIIVLIQFVAAAPVSALTAARVLPLLAAATIESLGLALVLPFLIAAQTLLYYDLRARAMLAAAAGQPLPTLEQADDAATPADEDEPPDHPDQ